MDTLSFTVLSVIFIPFLLFFLSIVLLAYIGKTVGVQQIYVDFLVKVFEEGFKVLTTAVICLVLWGELLEHKYMCGEDLLLKLPGGYPSGS